MRWFAAIAVAVVLIIVLIGAGFKMILGAVTAVSNTKVDFKDPEIVLKFKREYSGQCASTFKKRYTDAGVTLDAEHEANIIMFCNCVKDGVVRIFANRGGEVSIGELAEMTTGGDDETQAMAEKCEAQYGAF